MTRILAFADTQLGVSTVDLASQRAVLDQIVKIALEREVDMVLHGGDVFEGPVVLPEHMRMFIDATAPLREPSHRIPMLDNRIPLLVIRGNGRHDMATRHVHALDVLREIDGITVSDRPQGIRRDGVSIVTLPWVHPGALIAKMNGGITHENANEVTAGLLVRIAGELRAQAPADDKTVLLAHWAISGAKLPTGLDVGEMREPILPWADLDALGFDLVIGAHIHQQQIISEPFVDRTMGVVLGSPQQLNFGEHGKHGCWMFDLKDGGIVADFIPLDAPRFVTLDYDFVSHPEGMDLAPQAAIQASLATSLGNAPPTWAARAYVRLRYRCTEEQAQRFDHAAMRNAILALGASRVTVEPQIIKANRARVDTITEQLTQVEALVKWCEANEIAAPMTDRLVARLQEWS